MKLLLSAAFAALSAFAAEWTWKSATPQQAGLDAARLDALQKDLAAHNTTGLLIVRRGAIVSEWYAEGWNAERPHGTASMAKALVGGMSLLLATEDKLIRPDDLAAQSIPAWSSDPRKAKITIRHLATHTSGIEDAEQNQMPHDQLPGWKGAFWRREPDPFSIAIARAPAMEDPGTRYRYSNPGMAALAYAVTAALRTSPTRDIRALLKQRLMDPLGIPEKEWSIGYGRAYEVDGLPLYANWGGANYTARAAARVGQLMMDGGEWQGRSLISRTSVRTALTYAGMPLPNRGPSDPAPGSGLAWYTNFDGVWKGVPKDAFAGAGAGHQVIVVIPSLHLIVVRNGNAIADTKNGFWGPIYQHILEPLMSAVIEPGPYPPSPVIRKITFDPESTIRRTAIDSDNWPVTWGEDDALYTSYGDGFGFDPRTEKKLGMGFARINGPADNYKGENIRTPSGERSGDGARSPKASGILMVGGVLYAWVRNTGNAQLIWSNDLGKSWTWGFRFESSFGSPAFLNFGRNYGGARDRFVYTYSQDGPSAYESDNALLLARVPKDRITDRDAYEFFTSLDEKGQPQWTRDLARHGPVFRHPSNCQRVDAVYNPGLRRYLLAVSYGHTGAWGIFDAAEPWGPWTTAFHTQDWGLGGTHGYRLPSKWISADGATMTLIFSGVRLPNITYDAFCTRRFTLDVQR